MKKIVITDNIKKEFLKIFINNKCKIDNFSLTDIEIINETVKFGNKECKLLSTFKKYFEFLQSKIKNEKNFKEILFSNDLNELINKYSKFFETEETENVFVKNAYNSLRKRWGYKIVKLTKTDVCPYCNRNFVFNFDENKTTVELDHYYPKSEYPYLALNLYNLVPSCHTCNHKKNNSKKIHLHPCFDDIDKEINFSIKLKEANFYHSIKGFEIEVNGKNKKADNHIEVFNLQSIYNEHKDIILELIQKKYMYDESYLDELLRKYEGTLFKNKEDLLRLVSGGYISEDEINKRPLSKLIKDISSELNLS